MKHTLKWWVRQGKYLTVLLEPISQLLPSLPFYSFYHLQFYGRTNINLKDKYRNLVKARALKQEEEEWIAFVLDHRSANCDSRRCILFALLQYHYPSIHLTFPISPIQHQEDYLCNTDEVSHFLLNFWILFEVRRSLKFENTNSCSALKFIYRHSFSKF